MADGVYYGGNIDYDSAVIQNQICTVFRAFADIHEPVWLTACEIRGLCGNEIDEQSTVICGNVAKTNPD